MMIINLAGIQSIDYKFPIEKNMVVEVLHDVDIKYQTNEEKALVVKHENFILGYLPRPSTLKAWMEDARKIGNHQKYDYNKDRFIATTYVRDQIECDLFRNDMPVTGKIYRVGYSDNGDVQSISCSFDYM